MMSTFPHSLQRPERFDLYVRKFRATCAMHGIQVGSRADLSSFMQKLVEDRFFGMDFWKLVGKLSDREGGELSDDQVLALVVEGVTGGEISEEDNEARNVIDNLRAMLAGVDVQGQNQVELAPFPRVEAEPWQASSRTGIHAVEIPMKLADSREAFLAETIKADATPAAPSELPELDEEHLRQELLKLVEQYLEGVRRTRQKPPSEIASIPVITDTITSPPPEAPVAEEVNDLALTPTGKSRLVLEPDALAMENTLVPTPDAPLMRLSLDDGSSRSAYRRVTMYLVLVLALCAVGFALYRYRAPLLSELSLLRKDFERKTGIGASADRSPAPAVSSEAESSALQSAQAQQSPAPFSPATQSQANGSLGSPSSQTGQQIAAGGAILRNDRPTLPPDQLPENLISSADLAGTVQVSSNAMEAYLVASRVPAYPEAAKADGIQGSVEMQVIVAKDGTVKRVHVIQGDSRLRVAAAEAVYRWKYRPYLVDGEPVEVATTITVNFDLD